MRAGSWRHLGSFFSAPGFTSEEIHLFLATDLRRPPRTRSGPTRTSTDPELDAVARGRRPRRARRDPRRQVDRRAFWLARLRGEGGVEPVGSESCSAGGRAVLTEPGERVAVERRPRVQRDGEPQMRAGLLATAEPLEALAERVVRVVGRRVHLEQRARTSPRARSVWPELKYARPSASMIEPFRGSRRSARSRTIAAWA